MMTRTFLLIAALVLAGCDVGERLSPPVGGIEAARFRRPDVVVTSGQSIQAAVDAAGANAIIHLEPGLYAQAVTVTAAGVKIVGLIDHAGNGPIITNPGGVANGISVRPGANDF